MAEMIQDTKIAQVSPDETKKSVKGASHYIECQSVSLTFPMFMDDNFSFRSALINRISKRPKNLRSDRSALSNVSFTAAPGERIGLIGANGAGKTTLLRMLMGVYEPDAGKIVRRGRTASLINTTLGMDMYLSGYHNIFMRGQYMGMTDSQIAALVPEVEEFCELGDALHDPIRTYSSGMMARLAFGVATILEADIYLMDEWIGAGDGRFFDKANKRMEKLISKESILILASHSDQLISQWCNRVIVLDKGKVAMDTTPDVGLIVKNRILLG